MAKLLRGSGIVPIHVGLTYQVSAAGEAVGCKPELAGGLRLGGIKLIKLSPGSASSAVVLGSRLAQPPQPLQSDQ